MGIKERKERERSMRRKLIIDAAKWLFQTKGIEQTTMDEIARKAEFAKGTLYLYFKSKEDIQYEISMQGTDMLNERMHSAVNPNDSGLNNLVNVGWAFINYSRAEPFYFNLFMHFQKIDLQKLAIPREKIEDYFLRLSPFRLLIDLVETGIKDGSLRADLSPQNTATTLWSSLMGLLMVQQTKSDIYRIFKVDDNEILETNFDILMHGLVRK